MGQPRKPVFWIALAAAALSVGFCVASIFIGDSLGTALLVLGFAIFLPATTVLASQVSSRSVYDQADLTDVKQRPILSAAIALGLGLINLSQFSSSGGFAAHQSLLHGLDGVASILLIGYGGVSLLVGVLALVRARSEVRR